MFKKRYNNLEECVKRYVNGKIDVKKAKEKAGPLLIRNLVIGGINDISPLEYLLKAAKEGKIAEDDELLLFMLSNKIVNKVRIIDSESKDLVLAIHLVIKYGNLVALKYLVDEKKRINNRILFK